MNISEKTIIDLLFPYVRSVFGAKSRDEPEFVGSGFLLKNHEFLYLITAAHVMHHIDEEKYPLFLDGERGLVNILGEEISFYTKEKARCIGDKHDVSIVKLSHETQVQLGSVRYVEAEMLDVFQEHNSKLGYFCTGIPSKRGDKGINNDMKQVSYEPYAFFANDADVNAYEKLEVTQSAHLALNFNVKRVFSDGSNIRTAPALNGLSGAPIWGFRDQEEGKIKAVIVAILTEYHQRDIKAVLGTKISEVFCEINT